MPSENFWPFFRVTETSWSLVEMVALSTWFWSMSVVSWLKLGLVELEELDTTSFWATKARRMTMRMGKAALLKNRFTGTSRVRGALGARIAAGCASARGIP